MLSPHAQTHTHTHRRTQTHTSTHCHFFHRPSPFKYSFGSSSYSTLGVFAYKRLRSYISLHFRTLSLSGRPQSAVSFRFQVPFRTQDIRVLPPLQLIYIFSPHFSPQLTSLLLSKALRSKTARESCGPDQALAPLLICPAESKPPKGLWKRWVWYVSLSTCCVLHAEAVKPLLNAAQL
jgi:hypothetical protein